MLFIDTETRSSTPIKDGIKNYISDPDFTIIMFQWAVDNEPVRIWEPLKDPTPPHRLMKKLKEDTVVIHNSTFDKAVINEFFGEEVLKSERIIDTMVQAYAHGLPGKLAVLSKLYNLKEYGKLDTGMHLIRTFCIPQRDGSFINAEDDPDSWKDFIVYGVNDIEAMRLIYHKMPKYNYPKLEHHHWEIDQMINERGIPVDVTFAKRAVEEDLKERTRLNEEITKITNGAVTAATQRDKLLTYLKEVKGIEIPDMTAATIKEYLERNDLDKDINKILRIRSKASQNAAAKYRALLRHEKDGRLYHTIQMYGAKRTGRASGRVFQPQNLKRPTVWHGVKDIDAAIAADIDIVEAGLTYEIYGDEATDVIGSLIRSVVKAPEGYKIVQSDLSNIEGRTLVWLANEQWKLKFFSDFDAGIEKHDNYQKAYAEAMNVPIEEVGSEERAIGKVMELALGYGGGVSAFLGFVAIYGMDMDELTVQVKSIAPEDEWNQALDKFKWAEENGFSAGLEEEQFAACEFLKTRWRNAHPAVVKFWSDLENAFAYCTGHRNGMQKVGLLMFRREGSFVTIELPSGRKLYYLNPKVSEDGLSHYAENSMSRKLERETIYGGKFAENVTSAVARDILVNQFPRIEEAGYEIFMQVHDEVVVLAEDTPEKSAEELSSILSTSFEWSKGLPLAAAGFEAYRYRKD